MSSGSRSPRRCSTAYVVLDGFDFGAGALHLFVARTDGERRQVLAAIGPFWDGNEVWLLAAGGVLFVGFPARARLRALGLLPRDLPGALGARSCAASRSSSAATSRTRSGARSGTRSSPASTAPAGALRRRARQPRCAACRSTRTAGSRCRSSPTSGAAARRDPRLVHRARRRLRPGAPRGHGAAFLAWKTDGAVHERSLARGALRSYGVAAVALAARHARDRRVEPPVFWPPSPRRPLAWLRRLVAAAAARRRGSGPPRAAGDLAAFLGSCAFLAGLLGATAALVFPVMLRAIEDPCSR